jgi:hypothetical protein
MPEMGIVTCYFNYTRSAKRYKNFCEFYQQMSHQKYPLCVVEYACANQPFELAGVKNLIQIRGSSILWQKERLLQIGINRLLEQGFEKIAWVDADIIFSDPHWSTPVSQALDRWTIVQCFSLLTHRFDDEIKRNNSTIYQYLQHSSLDVSAGGIAWAARAEVLKKVGLYQYFIVGGGDAIFLLPSVLPSVSLFKELLPNISFPEAFLHHIERWLGNMHPHAFGKTGYVEQEVTALPHGTNKNRLYWERYQILQDFDPTRDLCIDTHGAFSWATPKPRLHQAVKDYLIQRDSPS